MGRQASLSTIPLFFIGALLMLLLACAHETWASTIEIESEPEYDESSANPFERFLLDSRTGGASTCKVTSKRCRISGGVCVEAGTCNTMDIPGSSCSKIGNFKTANCTCCAKDMSKICKPRKSCKDLGGFCVVNPKACRGEAILIKGGCNCKGWSNRGSCCKPIVTCGELNCSTFETCINYTHTETNTTLGKCECANGFIRQDGECVGIPCGDINMVKCSSAETCINSTHTETNSILGKCECANGFIRQDGECVGIPCGDINMANCSSAETCINSTHTETNSILGKCECVKGFIRQDGECVVGGMIANKKFIFNLGDEVNWNEAESRCTSRGQKLATIKDLQGIVAFMDANYAYSVTKDDSHSFDNRYLWVGGSDIQTEGTWVWTDGTAISDDADWSEHRYNNEDRDCLNFYFDGYYYPYDCSDDFGYICME